MKGDGQMLEKWRMVHEYMRKPKLYTNGDHEDRMVLQLLENARIEFIHLGYNLKDASPILISDGREWHGAKGIREFIMEQAAV